MMLPFWIFLYMNVDKVVKDKMIKHGMIGAIIAIATEHIFIKDYWVPPPLFGIEGFYSLEDFIYGFLIVGISISIYNYVFASEPKHIHKKYRVFSYALVILVLGSFYILSTIYGYNSTIVISLAMFAAAVVMIIIRNDLWKKALMSGLMVLFILIFIHMILFNIFLTGWWHRYWLLADGPYAYYILNIPWIEYIWYFSIGFFMSIISDFSHGRANNSTKK
ncbi:MAG: hypothetical protein HF962_02765 [Sulfurovum sp.]|nr:hypothetical protein [Sulfurovum sp.]